MLSPKKAWSSSQHTVNITKLKFTEKNLTKKFPVHQNSMTHQRRKIFDFRPHQHVWFNWKSLWECKSSSALKYSMTYYRRQTISSIVSFDALTWTSYKLIHVDLPCIGVVAGSMAAAWQASIGNVVAGSLFASFQSIGAVGIGLKGAAAGATGAAAGARAMAAGLAALLKQKKKKHYSWSG